MDITKNNIGSILKNWFSKTIYDFSIIDFNDSKIFYEALNFFIFDYHRYYPKKIK